MRFILTGGQRNDITQAPALLAGLKPKYVLADKGDDSRKLLAQIQSLSTQPVIPPRSYHNCAPYDKARYRLRNRIERCFARPNSSTASPLASTPSPLISWLSSASHRFPCGWGECRFGLVIKVTLVKKQL